MLIRRHVLANAFTLCWIEHNSVGGRCYIFDDDASLCLGLTMIESSRQKAASFYGILIQYMFLNLLRRQLSKTPVRQRKAICPTRIACAGCSTERGSEARDDYGMGGSVFRLA